MERTHDKPAHLCVHCVVVHYVLIYNILLFVSTNDSVFCSLRSALFSLLFTILPGSPLNKVLTEALTGEGAKEFKGLVYLINAWMMDSAQGKGSMSLQPRVSFEQLMPEFLKKTSKSHC